MTIIDDYLDFQEKYTKKYGEYTVVLMQVGHFYECYGVDNHKEKSNSENLYRLSDIMNIQLTRKNKNITENSRNNPLMIGVNIYSKDKYIQILLNANYTVVMIDQVSPPPEPDRAVTNIYSPGTNVSHISKGDSSNCMCLYLEINKDIKNYRDIMCIGLSCIDLSTGKNYIFETYSTMDDKNLALDEAFRFIQTYDPKEVLIITKDNTNSQGTNPILNSTELCNYLDLQQRVTHIYQHNHVETCYFELTYQTKFLGKIFKNPGLLSILEYLDLETKSFATISYVALLDFAYQHNENIINKINKPEILDYNNYLVLTNNCINQLNLVAHTSNNINTKFNSLFAVVNNCSTAIGRRYLRDTMLNPITDSEELNQRYDLCNYMQQSYFDNQDNQDNQEYKFNYQFYEQCLTKIMDVERLHRKLGLNMFQPSDFGNLDLSYEYINTMLEYINHCQNNLTNNNSNALQFLYPDNKDIDEFRKFIQEYKQVFNMDEIIKFHLDKITSSFFNRGVVEEIDQIQDTIQNHQDNLKYTAKRLSHILEDNSNQVKLEFNDRDGHYLAITTKRSQLLKQKFKNMNYSKISVRGPDNHTILYKLDPNDLNFKSMNKTSVRITTDFIKLTSNNLRIEQEKIKSLSITHFQNKCLEFYNKYSDSLREISKFVGNIDLYKSNAKTAILYGYHRPTILTDNENDKDKDKNKDNGSYLIAKEIRHPIIERIQTNLEYVTNDISIGIYNQKETETETTLETETNTDTNTNIENKQVKNNGMLLFGTNASGKSSLMKAIGINIIMAQSGMYVAASDFKFKPYTQLFTRINNNDNIFKGESSFAVEMSELRSILKRCDSKSLILGDELCSGTESVSAQSIFAASVLRLVSKNTNFIFATHLHELCRMDKIVTLENIDMFHLKVVYDPATETLIYDRKLEPGNGPAIYGLEVCKAMDMDPEFLEEAQEIRRQLLNQSKSILDTRKSHFNANVFVDDCQVCQAKAEDVHHIKFQCTADSNNMIGSIKKDSESNLVPLCKKCHDQVHNGNLIIDGYLQTSEGITLDFKFLEAEKLKEKKQKRKKYSDKQIAVIKEFQNQSLESKIKLSQKYIINKLLTEHQISISSSTLKKIWNDSY